MCPGRVWPGLVLRLRRSQTTAASHTIAKTTTVECEYEKTTLGSARGGHLRPAPLSAHPFQLSAPSFPPSAVLLRRTGQPSAFPSPSGTTPENLSHLYEKVNSPFTSHTHCCALRPIDGKCTGQSCKCIGQLEFNCYLGRFVGPGGGRYSDH